MNLFLSSLALLAQITATHYGESYNGSPMGCSPYRAYSSSDTTILAVSPSRAAQWPCGTELVISGPAGEISVVRSDTCPGCHHNMIDLSEAGSIAVCGNRPQTCEVRIIE